MSHINVNLKQCDCPTSDTVGQLHETSCAAAHVTLPCPIPLAVTLNARLGECDCPGNFGMGKSRREDIEHTRSCPARPMRVTCSIGSPDGTWASSFVTDAYVEEEGGRRARDATPEEMAAAMDRWNTVVKLLTVFGVTWAGLEGLRAQRDAIYTALADMARSEEAAATAQRALATHRLQARNKVHQARPEDRPSADYLAAYVKHLIEQVGAL